MSARWHLDATKHTNAELQAIAHWLTGVIAAPDGNHAGMATRYLGDVNTEIAARESAASRTSPRQRLVRLLMDFHKQLCEVDTENLAGRLRDSVGKLIRVLNRAEDAYDFESGR